MFLLGSTGPQKRGEAVFEKRPVDLDHLLQVFQGVVHGVVVDRVHHQLLDAGLVGFVQQHMRLFHGESGPVRDVVLANSAAVLVAGEKVENLRDGVAIAAEAIDSGEALRRVESLVKLSQALGQALGQGG